MSEQYCDPEDGGCGARFIGGHACEKPPKKPEIIDCSRSGCMESGWVRLSTLVHVRNCIYCGREMVRDVRKQKKAKA